MRGVRKDEIIRCYIYGAGMQYYFLSPYLKLYENKIEIL